METIVFSETLHSNHNLDSEVVQVKLYFEEERSVYLKSRVCRWTNRLKHKSKGRLRLVDYIML